MIEKTSKLSSKKVAMIILDQTKPKKRKQVLIYSDNGFQTLNKKIILELFLPNFELICSTLFCQLCRTIARCRFIGKQVSHPAESNAHLNRQTQKTKTKKTVTSNNWKLCEVLQKFLTSIGAARP
jgi:hypothetical protein